MRRILPVTAVALLLVAGYSAWPFYDLRALVRAAEMGDEVAVGERLDVPRLRRHFIEQMLHAYRRILGRTPNVLTEQSAIAVTSGAAESMAAKMASTEAVADLLRTGWPASVLGRPGRGFESLNFEGPAWRLYANTEYGFNEFRLWVPVSAPKEQQYRVTLRREGFAWKLSGVRLPAPIQDRLARELIRVGGPAR